MSDFTKKLSNYFEKKELLTDSNLKKGLSEKEAQQLLKKYGLNEIPEKEESLFHRILKRFWGPIPWMIEFAAFLSILVKRWEDFFVILSLLLINVVVDFWQEHKALSALKVLKEKLAKKALVLRDGEWKEVDTKYIVPKDIVKLKIGDIVPADVKIIEGFILVDQSSLTGESLLIPKKKGDLVYANSIIKEGEAIAVVVNTGLDTYFGKTVKLVSKAEREKQSHFQKMVVKIGNYLILITIFLVTLVILVGLHRHENFLELLRFGLVLTIAAIPVALPVVLTVTMAIGALKLVKKNVVVSRLSAIEELAGIDVLCSDKTGTLTLNKMTITSPYTFGIKEEDLIFFAALSSREEDKDPLETPLFEYLKNKGLYEKLNDWKILKFTPFNPNIKRTEALVENKKTGERLIVAKGAPQIIYQLSKDINEKEFFKIVNDFAEKKFRTIAVAVKKENEKKFHILGLIPLYDPPRPDSKIAIREAKDFGVEVKMVTGDNLAIAKNIAKILDIGDNILSMKELKERDVTKEYELLAEIIAKALYNKIKGNEKEAEKVGKEIAELVKKEIGGKITKANIKRHESEIIKIIEEANGFAEVLPEDKYFIVDKLQKADHIVGMTGDGVNDAPALKKADCGIAVVNATDAAKAAADIVLLTPGLKVIIDGLKISRQIFARMESYVLYRITETIRVLIFLTLSIIFFNFYPLTPIMVILLALLNDIPILAIAYDNVKISKKPVRWKLNETLILATVLGITGVITSFGILFLLVDYFKLPESVIRTIIFLKLLIAGHLTIFVARNKDWLWKRPFPSKLLFTATISTVTIGSFISLCGLKLIKPISVWWVIFVLGYAITSMIINDFIKKITLKIIKENKHFIHNIHKPL